MDGLGQETTMTTVTTRPGPASSGRNEDADAIHDGAGPTRQDAAQDKTWGKALDDEEFALAVRRVLATPATRSGRRTP